MSIVSSPIRPLGALGTVDSASKILGAFNFEDDKISESVNSGFRSLRVCETGD